MDFPCFWLTQHFVSSAVEWTVADVIDYANNVASSCILATHLIKLWLHWLKFYYLLAGIFFLFLSYWSGVNLSFVTQQPLDSSKAGVFCFVPVRCTVYRESYWFEEMCCKWDKPLIRVITWNLRPCPNNSTDAFINSCSCLFTLWDERRTWWTLINKVSVYLFKLHFTCEPLIWQVLGVSDSRLYQFATTSLTLMVSERCICAERRWNRRISG